jgi:predicted Fe-Mo cluster-binding NifX family protein
MKIAITSTEPNINAPMDPRFGRAPCILLVDSETFDFEVIDNTVNRDKLKGAGIHASALISNAGAQVLITGFCGPNAMKTLGAAKIKVALHNSNCVKTAIEAFKEGKIDFSTEPNTSGHSM